MTKPFHRAADKEQKIELGVFGWPSQKNTLNLSIIPPVLRLVNVRNRNVLFCYRLILNFDKLT